MPSKPIEVGVAADTKPFERGIKSGVIEPLDKAGDALEAVSKAGDAAGDDLVDTMRDAQRAKMRAMERSRS